MAVGSHFTPGHTVRVLNPQGTALGDAGGAAGSSLSGQGYLTELGITNTGCPFEINDALTNASGGYHALSLCANSNGSGVISYNAFGGAAPLPLQFNINGITTNLPINVSGATNFLTVAQFGAKCDGATSDSAAFQSALNAAGLAGGGVVWQQPTGAACRLATGISIPAGVHLIGAGGLNWTSPIDNVESHWTSKSSWLRCEDTTNPCVTIAGSSASVEGFNFWYTQPTPTGGNCSSPCTYTTYSPTIYPYTIYVAPTASVGVWINNSNIVNASHCVDWEGPASGVSGIYSGMDRDSFGCFVRGAKFHLIDNTLTLTRLRYEMWWFQGNSQWWYAQQNGHVDWDIQYLANPQINDVEFTFGGIAMQFTDACVTSGFGSICLATSAMQAKGVSFNENCQAMTVASPTTHVSGVFDGPILFTDSTTSPITGQCARATPYAINLASDNANVTLRNVQGGFVQSLAFIGGGGSGGVHGQLHLTGTVQQYSAYAAGAAAVATDATGSFVDFNGGTPLFYPSTTFTAGAMCTGAGCSSNSNSFFGNLEVGGLTGSTRELYFSQISTPEAPAFNLGLPQWGMRADAGGNLYFDRFNPATGAFIDPVLYAVPLSTTVNNTELHITGKAVLHGGNYVVPVLISALPTCGPSNAGMYMTVSNGLSSPTYNAVVSATGSSAASVFCNNTNWVYQ